jgi:16S rRNA (cytidine1402-2'-O)-methyltransferase
MADIFLIPVTLGGSDPAMVVPDKVIGLTRRLRCFIVEDIRSARRYLRSVDRQFPVDDCTFFELNEHTRDEELEGFLNPVLNGTDTGLMSEAGLPCLADPGAKITALAHMKNIRIIPLSGPSSIIMALIASGFGGQNFTFNGYLPVKPGERVSRLKEIEKKAREGYTQVFMETPYRNGKMFDSVVGTCSGNSKLCVAADITLPTEFIRSMSISEWKKNRPQLDGRPAVFILG